MTPTRRTSLTAGVLFVLATTTALAASAVEPEVSGTAALAALPGSSPAFLLATLLHLAAAGTSVGIAIALYPVIRAAHATLAIGSVVFRTIEAVFYAVGAVSLVAVLPLSRELAAAPTDQQATISAIAETMVGQRDHAVMVGVIAFCTGALLYYLAFYRSTLLPRWLSAWGALGALSMLTACALALVADRPVTGYVVLALPIAVQEMVLAGWLLVRGFAEEPAPERTAAPALA
ncbi:DUF4386 domain-containing protein [Actinotalea sp. M2MS4P-6]|uniref:DUF4386 domain-containing protein n=1 Tax=Actinotalea sp. M2MS4P-6 TaxID=2983762 RepID=UPI0021E47F39|nr:DUF4386 domain-containing protein [Actinotalea sp. M2MS4P-6]MCV2393662.1 DUF4386 domain-containing protein [Actinotalea sp. M2MS4P-6]